MLTTQWKTDLDRLDALNSAIPLLSKEDMKRPVSWDVSVVEYTWPTMPCVAANQFERIVALPSLLKYPLLGHVVLILLSWKISNSLSSDVVTFGTKRKHFKVGDNFFLDPEAIYACVIGLLNSQCDLNMQQVLSTDLTAWGKPLESQHWKYNYRLKSPST